MTLTLLIVGETGAGKSSLINMLADKKIATVSADAPLCTRYFSEYTFGVNSIQVHVYDTVGFGSAHDGNSSNFIPYEVALDMLRSLKTNLDLIFLCTNGERLNPMTRRLYSLFHDFFFDKTVPIVLIVTHREKEAQSMDDWWSRNKDDIKNFDFAGHACITTTSSYKFPTRRKQSKESVVKLLSIPTSYKRRTLDEPKTTLLDRLNSTNFLTEKCGLSHGDASFLTRKANLHIRIPNIVLFGMGGAGKSSVVNLIADAKVAETSDGVDPVTLDSTEYRLNLKASCLRIFDTVGLNDPTTMKGKKVLDAEKKAITLIQMLKRVGGVDLLLFCIDNRRIHEHHQINYKLFREGLGQGRVPVAVLVTHLERMEKMEDWWTKNEKSLTKKFGIECQAHACITTISEYEKEKEKEYEDKRRESRRLVLELLEKQVKEGGKPFIMDSDTWLSEFMNKLRGLVKK